MKSLEEYATLAKLSNGMLKSLEPKKRKAAKSADGEPADKKK